MRLKGKVAIVTGGTLGIGLGIVERFAREGARVVIGSRNQERGQVVVDRLRAEGGDVAFVPTDVRVEAECQRLVERTLALHGALHVLVNNAGVGLLRAATETSEEDFYYIVDTNLKGPLMLSKYAIPPMAASGGGSIIHLASVAGFVGFERDAAYCASKGAVLMLTRQMALDYARQNIRVNCICPGFIVTPELEHYLSQHPDPEAARREVEALHPMGRIGTPADIAAAAVFLASDESAWITGTPLIVDGGLLARA